MIENVIMYCAPTLAGVKTANMFSYRFTSIEILTKDIHTINMKLNPKGVFAEILHITNNSAKIFVYRLSRLIADLAQDDTQAFLNIYGYRTAFVDDCISCLKDRFLSGHGFPHEIGLFLGYPLHDVVGFIQNCGKNSKRSGCWKVYHDEKEAERKFAIYQNCKKACLYYFSQGKPIEHLVA